MSPAMNLADDYTLCIIKPDAYEHRLDILSVLSAKGFREILSKTQKLSAVGAAWFYTEHAGKSFFQGNVDFMSSGLSYSAVLYKPGTAVASLREVLGATDPAKAATGTIRQLYGSDLPKNAAHGSDSRESFKREAQFLFSGLTLLETGVVTL